jgi:hypothetical protein
VSLGKPVPLDTRRTMVGVWPLVDRGKRTDGTDQERALTLGVAAAIRVDPTDSQAIYEQLYADWLTVQNALEGLTLDNCNGLCTDFVEDGQGVEYADYEPARNQTVALAGAFYVARFERGLGTDD